MATTNYYSLDGMLIGEETGGVVRNYGTSALGSVVETSPQRVEENTYCNASQVESLQKPAPPPTRRSYGDGRSSLSGNEAHEFGILRAKACRLVDDSAVDDRGPNVAEIELAYGYSKEQPCYPI